MPRNSRDAKAYRAAFDSGGGVEEVRTGSTVEVWAIYDLAEDRDDLIVRLSRRLTAAERSR